MDLDRGALANLDRGLLAELDRDGGTQMVRVPVSPAMWSTWKRYCAVAGISMGRALLALIDRELTTAFHDPGGDGSPVLAHRAREQLARREAAAACRERAAASAEKRLSSRSERLRRRELELDERERRVEMALQSVAQRKDTAPKVGRNDRCPCGSGRKYNHCHGLTGRSPNGATR